MYYGICVMFPVFKQQIFKVKGILLLLNVICSLGKENSVTSVSIRIVDYANLCFKDQNPQPGQENPVLSDTGFSFHLHLVPP